MNYDEFAKLVLLMRNAQRNYFKTRSSDWLNKAKELEKRVDEELKLDPRQGKLFDDDSAD